MAEVGVARGEFSAQILASSAPTCLYLIDAWTSAQAESYGNQAMAHVEQTFEREVSEGVVKLERGLSSEKMEEFDDSALDWVYVDAAHDFDSVMADLEVCYRKVKHGGFICGHDYHRWGRNGQRFGVLEAVNRFCVDKDLRLWGLSVENDYNWSYALAVVKAGR